MINEIGYLPKEFIIGIQVNDNIYVNNNHISFKDPQRIESFYRRFIDMTGINYTCYPLRKFNITNNDFFINIAQKIRYNPAYVFNTCIEYADIYKSTHKLELK